ncbi:(2Fe-2S)-binding protein [Thalassobacillus pellis]|uniref:(2Fe-2S)-binding protein n=1 Tax=Thalassobacillus pellis TaxID=748008 RepID=UPI001960DCC8|nr:(2Fe-2S)-binding protein [Thalassobacillus pellis]MBM7554776.1 ferric iron reductase protein FhuF [Thalassobacillus pellis]
MNYLTDLEEAFLDDNFRYLSRAYSERVPLEVIQGEELQSEDELLDVLENMHTHIESDFFLTTASIFSKRYGYYVVTGFLVLISAFNKCPDVNLSNIRLVRMDEDKKWFPKLEFLSKEVIQPEPGEREKWLRESLRKLFRENLRPILLNVHELTRLSMNVLWENFTIYLYWFYETFAEKHFNGEQLAQIYDDFHIIVNELEGEAFGETDNPLGYFQYQPKLPSGARERKYCCLSYRWNEESGYCKTCPHRC